MRFAVLGSGSKGNSLVVQAGKSTVLVDAGLPPKVMRKRLRALGLELGELSALVITHAHGDHIAAAPVLAGALRLRTFATEGCQLEVARLGGLGNPVTIETGEPFAVGALNFCAYPTPHDASGSVGYLVDDGDDRLGICTDLGRPDPPVGRALRDCDTLVLEFNHDLEMLMNGPYPQVLRDRVAGPYGHLNNDDAAVLLRRARTPSLRKVFLAHLSETNNTVDLAMSAARGVVDGADIELAVLPQHHPTGWMKVGKAAGTQSRPPLAAVCPRSTRRPRPPAPGEDAPVPGSAGARKLWRRRPRPTAQSLAVKKQLSLFGGGSS